MSTDLENLRIDRSLKGSGNRRRHWPWWLAALLAAGGVLWTWSSRTKIVEVDAAIVQQREAAGEEGVVLNATGYIIAAHKIELAPKVMGRVAWVGVERADKVHKDQELVRLEDDEFRARVAQAQGQLDAAKARLAELVNGSRPEEIAKAQAELDAANADLDSATARYNRLRAINDSKAVPIQDVEDALYRQNAQKARVASLQATCELLKKGPRVEQIAAARAATEEASGTLALARNDLANTLIKAPVAGTILARNVEVGEYVTTGFVGEGGAKGYVVSLADLSELRVELDVSQDDFARVRGEQKCWVTTDAYPDRKYEGVIDLLSPEANRQKATVQVRVKILKPDDLLRPEMNASVAFRADPQSTTAPPDLLVPASAIRDGAVFVITDGKAIRRTVESGATMSKGVQIRKGLSAGEQVITAPPEGLKDGQAVSVRR